MDFIIKRIAALMLCMMTLYCGVTAMAAESAQLGARPNSQKYVAEIGGLYQYGQFMSDEEAQACMVALEDTEMVNYIHDGLLKREEEIYLDMFDEPMYPEQLETYYQAILNNYPDMYFVSLMYQYYIYDDGTLASIVPIYTMPEDEIVRTQALIDEEVAKVCAVVREGMSDYDKILAVHDYFAENYCYDYKNLYDDGYMRKHNIAALFVDKTAVCQGYGLGFQYVMQKLGIECTTVQSPPMLHLWNLVQLENGNWYHVDLTWDDPSQDWYNGTPVMPDTEFEMLVGIEREYLMLSDSAIKSKENAHYDYTPDGMADDNSYSEAGLNDASTAMAWAGGDWYYFDSESKLHKFNAAMNTDEVVFQIDDKWPYLNITFADAYEYNGKVYYNTASKIMVYDPASGTNSVALSSVSGVGSGTEIYSLSIVDGKLICTVASEYKCEDATQQSIGMGSVSGSGSGNGTTPNIPDSNVSAAASVSDGNTVVTLTGISSGVVCAVKYDGDRVVDVRTHDAAATVTFEGIEADKILVWSSISAVQPLCNPYIIE